MTTRAIPFSEVLDQALADPDFKAEWERTQIARELAILLLRYRAEQTISQHQLARLLGVKQPAVARLEVGEVAPTTETLRRVCQGLGVKLTLTIDPTGAATLRSAHIPGYVKRAPTGDFDSTC